MRESAVQMSVKKHSVETEQQVQRSWHECAQILGEQPRGQWDKGGG